MTKKARDKRQESIQEWMEKELARRNERSRAIVEHGTPAEIEEHCNQLHEQAAADMQRMTPEEREAAVRLFCEMNGIKDGKPLSN